MVNKGNNTRQFAGVGLAVTRLGNVQLGFSLIRRGTIGLKIILFILFLSIPLLTNAQVEFRTENQLMFEIIQEINRVYSKNNPNDTSLNKCCVIFEERFKSVFTNDLIENSYLNVLFGEDTLIPISRYFIKVNYPVLVPDKGFGFTLQVFKRSSKIEFEYSCGFFYLIVHDNTKNSFTFKLLPPFAIIEPKKK